MRMVCWLVVGIGIGILIGYAAYAGSGDTPVPDDLSASQDKPQQAAHLSTTPYLRQQVSSLKSRLQEKDRELASLRERLAGMISAEGEPVTERSPFEDARLTQLAHYFDQTRWTYEEALSSSARSTSQIQRYIVAVPEADLEGFMADVWAGRVKRMERAKLILTEDQNELVRRAMQDGWLAYRKFMHESYKPKIEGAETEADLIAARQAAHVKWAQVWATLNHRVLEGMMKFPDGKGLVEALGPFL